MPETPLRQQADLRLPQKWRRVTGASTAVSLVGLAMTGIVFANYANLRGAATAFGVWGLCLYFLGTAAYRVTLCRPGVVESHTVLGLHRVDLTKGFSVRQARYGRVIVLVRVGRRRVRLNGGLGSADEIERWLRDAAT